MVSLDALYLFIFQPPVCLGLVPGQQTVSSDLRVNGERAVCACVSYPSLLDNGKSKYAIPLQQRQRNSYNMVISDLISFLTTAAAAAPTFTLLRPHKNRKTTQQ